MRLSLLDDRRKFLLQLDEDKSVPKYTVRWLNDDGTVLELDEKVLEGGMPDYGGQTPTKAATSTIRYEFAGWSPTPVHVTGDAIYIATFTEIPITHIISWLNYDGSLIRADEVNAGTTPSYNKPPVLIQPLMYDYVKGYINGSANSFVYEDSNNCRSDVYEVESGKQYSLELDETVGTRFRVMLAAQHPVEDTSQITYGDSISGSAINIVNNPAPNSSVSFTAASNGYLIVQKDNAGVSGLKTYLYKTVSTITPTKPSTAQYYYEFVGWTPAIVAAYADASYTATFQEIHNSVTATFVRASEDGGGTLQAATNVAYGTTPSYTGPTPTTTKGSPPDFTFYGWNPPLGPITQNTTFVAVFKDSRSYTVQFLARTIKEYEG